MKSDGGLSSDSGSGTRPDADIDPCIDEAYQKLVDALGYLEPDELALIGRAYAFSVKAHRGQKRVSGEPYVTHPLAVARTLAEWRLDAQALAAALLHDVMEDTAVTKAEIAENFGQKIADMVDGLSKLGKIAFSSYQVAQAENFRKMLMAMARDLRIVMIKLADRLHNLRTMSALRPDKRRRIARETLEIHAPIATHLGISNIARQLEDISFMHLHPVRYRVLEKAVEAAHGNRGALLSSIFDGIRGALRSAKVDAGALGREKSLYSIHKKMVENRLNFSQVLDIYTFQVIVKRTPECYLALGALHAVYKPVPGKFNDYIAIPKRNGYQSLHTTLIGPHGMPIEVRIRTQEMHSVAEDGIASHWLYKESAENGSELRVRSHEWFEALLDLQTPTGDSSEFFEHVKGDLFPDEVYVFTPKGKIFSLPLGATVIDFAYAVHTDIGHHCVAAHIDQKLLPLSTELSSGNQVEIITSPTANPAPVWLTYAKTGRARSKIRHFLKSMEQEGSSALGEKMLARELQSLGIVLSDIPPSVWDSVLHKTGNASKNEFFSDIGLGRKLAPVIARQLAGSAKIRRSERVEAKPLLIRGSEGTEIHFSSCCWPIPGDPIIGFLHNEQGLQIHTLNCPVIAKSRGNETPISVEWEPAPGQLFNARIRVSVKNIRGILGQVASGISQVGINIDQVDLSRESLGLFRDIFFLVQVSGRRQLADMMRALRRIPDVVRIVRESG
ncbi:MAG: bifunctional (p)ppGpp synthetase/guanosine-3',5'-bis(diphosphate) 3'-pyrophosphohydrolase [Candidatus Accumulibacter sp.]|jgi:GTP pyrophosphokinase/guanosine-3',5'-bis(diphosphate) 3'-pyrophosphohydrolase|nr:bifunctional (p)ppGpp synthetase/guanosine-3',5'-bis(diphosphate) 3'-pyrophosphohydrolase [Accumulibacter sp.]